MTQAGDEDDWTWEQVVAKLDEVLPTVSVRPGLARVTVPTDGGGPRVVRLVMTVEDFEEMTVVDGPHLEVIRDRVVDELRAMPPQRHYLAYVQYGLAASRTMPPSPEELERASRAGSTRLPPT